MPRVQVPLKKANARSWASNTISCVSRGVGPHERHPAVAQPDMRHLYRYRRAVDQHDLVAPVELIRLAWRKAQRNKGIHRRCRAVTLPAPRIAPYRVVTARVAEPAQLLENSDQRQSLAARLRLVRDKQAIKAVLPRTDPRPWLLLALVAKLRPLGS